MTISRTSPAIVLGILLLASLAAASPGPAEPQPARSLGIDILAQRGSTFVGPIHDQLDMVDVQGEADDVTMTVTAMESAFGPETYKYDDRTNARNPDDVENQTTVWETALGHRLTATVDIGPGDLSPDCQDRFIPDAYIVTTGGRLYGYTPGQVATPSPDCAGVPGVRTFPLTFDLDGAAPTVTGSPFPALLPGVYAIQFDLYHARTPGPGNPSGVGHPAGSIQIPFSVAPPQITPPEPPFRFPESTLRLFSDVGATAGSAHEYAMLQSPLRSSGSMNVTIAFPGSASGSTFERIDHHALRTGPDLDTPTSVPEPVAAPTPLDELIDKTGDGEDRLTVNVVGTTLNLSNDTVPSSGVIMMPIRGADFRTETQPAGESWVPLQVVTIHVKAHVDHRVTGAASLVVPVSDSDHPVRHIRTTGLVDNVPQSGRTEVLVLDPTGASGGATGFNAGDLFALRPLGFAHEPITQVRLSREDPASPSWVTGTFNHLTFAGDVERYTILAMLYGSNGEFYGMSLATRGIQLDVDALRIVEGRSGDLLVTITNLADDRDGNPGEADYAVTVNLTGSGFPDGEPYTRPVGPLNEGSTTVVRVPVAGSAPGAYNVVFTATSGELTMTRDTTVQVISKEQAAQEDRKWYNVPAPGAFLLALALIAIVALARRRP